MTTKVKAGVINADAVITAGILNANVTAAKLATDAVETAKIKDVNVTTAKIADNAVTLAKLNGGTASKYLGFDGSGNPAEVNAPIFTESYASSGQTITSAGQLTLAHGLAGSPKLVQCYIKCTDAGGDAGYSQNDEVIINNGSNDINVTADRGLSTQIDSTNVTIRYGAQASSCITILDGSDGTYAPITNTKWQLYVRAWY
jgi:hypothetical protein